MRSVRSLAVAGALVIGLAACGDDGGTGGPGGQRFANGKTFTMVLSADPGNLDPHFTSLASTLQVDRFLYDSLLNVDADGKLVAGLAEKWDLYMRGFELATAYSELVDPVVQRDRLVAQAQLAAKGDDEAMRLDEDFLRAMEYGMPPAGGMGMGIDRLLMALTGLGIRETILFPLVRPE